MAIIPLCLAAAFWWLRPHLAFDTDSPRYLTASAMRTATYPLFLRATYGPALLPLQLFLFAASLSWAVLYSSRLLPWAVAAAMVLAMAANPFLWQLQGTVMSEALTTPLLTLLVAGIVGFATTHSRPLAIANGLLCGIATTARPSLLPLIIAPLCLIWIAPRLRGRVMLSAITLLAFAAPIVAERIYSRIVHGAELTSPLGRQLFMKAAIIDAPGTTLNSTDPLDRELVRELNDGYEPVRRLLKSTSDREVRWILLTNYESCAGYSCFTSDWARFPIGEAELHRHLAKVALARLESNPLGYLRLTASEYPRMWLLHQRKVPRIARKYNAFLAHEAPIPFQDRLGAEFQPTPPSEQRTIFALNRAAFALIGIAAAAMTIALPFLRRGRMSQSALALLLATQAVLVFSAFFGSAQVRYAMGMWPTLIAGLVLGAAALLHRWKPQLLAGPSRQEADGSASPAV
jgi:hypothetical protein